MSVFAVGVLVGLAVFKDDWDTQRAKAEDFLGGTRARRGDPDSRYTLIDPTARAYVPIHPSAGTCLSDV